MTTAPGSRRNPSRERREQRAFLVLLHLHNLSEGNPTVGLACDRLTGDLALQEDGPRLIERLVAEGYFDCPAGSSVSITPKGVRYVETLAGRRRSVRFSGDAP